MNTADDYLFENANKPMYSEENSKFLQKRMVFVNDVSGGSGNYPSNSVEISTSVLTNSALWCGYGEDEACIEIPVVLAMHPVDVPHQVTTAGIHNVRNWEDCKNVFQLEQYHNLISGGISIQYNNTQISQKIPFHHRMITWKLISEANILEKEKNSAFYGEFDSGTPFIVNNNVYNNIINDTTEEFHTDSSPQFNVGASKRIEQTNNASVSDTWYTDSQTFKQRCYMDFTQTFLGDKTKPDTITAITAEEFQKKMQTYVKYYIAKIRLKDLSSFLAQSNLVRGSFLTLKFNFNSVKTKLKLNHHATEPYFSLSDNQIIGEQNPSMVANSLSGLGLKIPTESKHIVTGENQQHCEYMLEMNVGKLSTTPAGFSSQQTFTHPIIQGCRLAVPTYTFSPLSLKNYLALNSQPRLISYEEAVCYTFDVAAGASVNQLLSSSIINAKYLLMVPTLTAQTINTNVLPEHSPFLPCSLPCAPYWLPEDFQLHIASTPQFQSPLNTKDDFLRNSCELLDYNALQGNRLAGLTSNLVTKNNHLPLYNYLLFNLTNRLSSENNIPKSISVSFRSPYKYNIKLTCYIVFSKEAAIEVETGRLIPM